MRLFVIRYGAIGDMVFITPLLKHLKAIGHEVYLNTSETGMEVLRNCPYVDKFVPYVSNSVPAEQLDVFWESQRKLYECDKILNMCESIEVALSMHPSTPAYNLPKQERLKLCNKNYYDYTFEFANKQESSIQCLKGQLPELYFTPQEEDYIKKVSDDFRKKTPKLIMWALTGSGRNKTYPYYHYIVKELLDKYPDLGVITVGDVSCKIMEYGVDSDRIYKRSGMFKIRESLLFTKYVDLVIAPDTGVLHGSGCYDTPKIGLLGHVSLENTTKYYKNNYSLEANVPCSPCNRLIFDATLQCPTEPFFGACWCMGIGLSKERVQERIEEVLNVKKS